MRPCFKSLKHVYGHQSNFSKTHPNFRAETIKSVCLKQLLIDPNMVYTIWTRFFCHFQKGTTLICYLLNWGSYFFKLLIFDGFCYNCSCDHTHAWNSKNRVSFFPQDTILSAEIVFVAQLYAFGIKKFNNVRNFGSFFILIL